MRSTLGLVLLAALCGAALASRELVTPAPTGRELLQTGADCSRSVPNCATCRFQFFRGTVTRTICTRCTTGYTVKSSGRACWCAAGYKAEGSTCVPCGAGSYCGGSKTTLASATATSCGANKVTTTPTAKSVRECSAEPGYGWANGNAVACAVGTYNPGFNTRACTRCPGSLTTMTTLKTAPADCVADAGFYFLRGKAIACAQGTYKAAKGNADCDKCPDGTTTAFGQVGKTAKTDCNKLMMGYAAADGAIGDTAATLCPANTYNDKQGLLATTLTASPIECTPCGGNLVTLPGVEGATSFSSCVAPPGYGFDAATGTATQCDAGTYNPGNNREACVSCGTGTITSAAGSDSDGDCYVPPGNFMERSSDGVSLVGAVCPADTYGRENITFGLVEFGCDKCPENSVSVAGSTSGAACLTSPGYGWYDGQVKQCEYGYWSDGGDQAECDFCGEGYNTTTAAGTADANEGAIAGSECQVGAGWYVNTANATGGLSQCPRGQYKSIIGDVPCTACPSGTTTTIVSGATALSDCDACDPGFGGLIASLAAPECGMCASGTYAPGFVSGGEVCGACPKPALFNTADDLMVSRPGITTPEDCVGQFPTSGSNDQSLYAYDIIGASPSAVPVTDVIGDGDTTLAACQTACKDDAACLFFTYFNYNETTSAGSGKCFLRKAAAAISTTEQPTISTTDPAAFFLLLEVEEGLYATYPAVDGTGVGTTIVATQSFADAKAACDEDPACIGFQNTATGAGLVWRTFSGSKWEGATTKVKAYGYALNAWVALPSYPSS